MTGLPPDQISVIGSITYDAVLRRARAHDREAERHALGLSADERLVVVATQPMPLAHNRQLVDLTLDASIDLPFVRTIVKLHPKEPESRIAVLDHQVRQRGMSDRASVTRELDIYLLLAAADLVVTMTSNVGIEAVLLDRDMVAVEIDLEMDHFSLSENGLIDPAYTREDATRQIRQLLTDPQARAYAKEKRRSFFEANPQLRDGRSLERLLDIVRSL